MQAISMADTDGLAVLSMRKLALSLDIKAMSLYNHVSNKDDLLDGMLEIIVKEMQLPSMYDNWKTAMQKRSISAHQVLLQHPWASILFLSRIDISSARLQHINATIGCFVSAGFSYQQADYGWNLLDNHIYGFTLQVLNFPFEPSEYASAAKEFLPMIPEEQYPFLYSLSKLVIDGTHNGTSDFHFGLEIILDGLEWILQSNTSQGMR